MKRTIPTTESQTIEFKSGQGPLPIANWSRPWSVSRTPMAVHQAGFEELQQEQMVRKFAEAHGEIRWRDAMALCRLTGVQASRLLTRLVDEGVLEPRGQGHGTFYVLAGAR